MTMHALHWDGHTLRVQAGYPIPQATEDTAVVRVRLAGVCSTDLQILKGYMAFEGVPGHEFVGEVHAGPSELMGKRVVGEINFACGRCEQCLRGMARILSVNRAQGTLLCKSGPPHVQTSMCRVAASSSPCSAAASLRRAAAAPRRRPRRRCPAATRTTTT